MNARERPSEHSNRGAKPVNLSAAWEAITCQPWREMNVVTSTAECGRVSDTRCAWQLVRKSRPCHSQTRVKGTKALRLGMGASALGHRTHDRCPSLYTWGREGLTCPATSPTFHVSENDFELLLPLPLFPECWGDRYTSPHSLCVAGDQTQGFWEW